MQAYRERTLFLLLPWHDGHSSGGQQDRNKRKRSEADVNGSGGTIPWRDVIVQIAEPPSLQENPPTSVETETNTYLVQQPKDETHEIERKDLDIGQKAVV